MLVIALCYCLRFRWRCECRVETYTNKPGTVTHWMTGQKKNNIIISCVRARWQRQRNAMRAKWTRTNWFLVASDRSLCASSIRGGQIHARRASGIVVGHVKTLFRYTMRVSFTYRMTTNKPISTLDFISFFAIHILYAAVRLSARILRKVCFWCNCGVRETKRFIIETKLTVIGCEVIFDSGRSHRRLEQINNIICVVVFFQFASHRMQANELYSSAAYTNRSQIDM